MIAELDDRFMKVPGTDFIVLRDDSALGKWALQSGSIMGEKYVRDLPCVRNLKPGDICLDVGAFVGDTAVIFLERECKVIAIEPYDDAFECLKNNCPSARCIHAAAGDGTPLHPTGRNVEGGANRGCSMVEVGGGDPSLRIDDLNLEKLTIAKIDVEGSESRVLDGMIETIRRCRPVILIESYGTALAIQGFDRDDILHRLWREGYAVSVAIGRAEDDRVDFLAVPTEKPLL